MVASVSKRRTIICENNTDNSEDVHVDVQSLKGKNVVNLSKGDFGEGGGAFAGPKTGVASSQSSHVNNKLISKSEFPSAYALFTKITTKSEIVFFRSLVQPFFLLHAVFCLSMSLRVFLFKKKKKIVLTQRLML